MNLRYISSKINFSIRFFWVMLAFFSFSCNEEDFLKEIPLDFYSPENSYVTFDDYEAAVYNLYARYTQEFWNSSGSGDFPYAAYRGTDLVHGTSTNGLIGLTSSLIPTSGRFYDQMWRPAYHLIYDANVIIRRVEEADLTEEQRTLIIAEARFFRGLAHKMLANVYGGVPIVTEETLEPKRNFQRATRQEVYEHCASDLLFAAENLNAIDEGPEARVNNLVAYHVLAEVYCSLERWDDAISTASIVIDHPATDLMEDRFGTQVDPEVNRYPAPFNDSIYGGDVYWDLFRPGNQNRNSGNTEALWVTQYAIDVPGGGPRTGGGTNLERQVCARTYRLNIINDDGTVAPLAPEPNTYLTGRGIGGMRPTNYFLWGVWAKSGPNDMRNSKYNIVRDVPVMNPESDHFGKWLFADNVPFQNESESDTTRNWYPIVAKATTVGRHPELIYHPDQTVPGSLTSAARVTYRDNYIYRLAETYLLRAEAYLGKNDLINAAGDINVVRARAEADPVTTGNVTMDYLLDERMRELYFEEFYIITLMRLGKLVERTNQYNPLINYSEHHNLWPIPFSEIEKNTGAFLQQNPGYN